MASIQSRCYHPPRKRASWKDAQTEVRTKLPDADFDALAAWAQERGVSVYQAARALILAALYGRELRLYRRSTAEPLRAPASRDADRGAPDRGAES